MTESDIYEAIAAAHCPPEWACFRDVANATGWAGARRADAVAMNLYPSRGLEVRGFEIKTDRGDLRRELSDPDKAELIAKYCNTWWLAVPKGLCDKDDVPLSWGIMEVGEKGLRTKRSAVPRQADEVTTLNRPFVAALARAAHKEIEQLRKNWIPRAEIQERLDAKYLAGAAAAPREAEFLIRTLERKVDGARPVLAAMGIDIDTDDWKDQFHAETGKRTAREIAVGRAVLQRYGGAVHAKEVVQVGVARLQEVLKSLDELLAGDVEQKC